MPALRKLPLLEIDPDLGALLPQDQRTTALRELEVEVYRLPKGPWAAGEEDTSPEHVGLLLLEGVIAREVLVSNTVSTELLGAGDLVRPWSVERSPALLQLAIRWNALTVSRVAVLDRRLGARLARWPEVNAALIDRVNARAKRLAITQAISQLNRVDRRLLSLFWHLAERWGQVSPDGVAIPLTLSHRMLGQLVGARRPTISTAVADLASRNELVRRGDGTWLLRGEAVGPPTKAAERLLPIRRELDLATPERIAAVSIPEEPPQGFVTAPTLVTGRREVPDRLARLRTELQLHVDHTAELMSESQRLHAELIARRERRTRGRADRVQG